MSQQNSPLKLPDISKYGLSDVQRIYYNLSYKDLFKHETDSSLNGFERGFETNTGAVAVDTGEFTGRSPKDKYIVREPSSKNSVWWTSEHAKNDNKPINPDVWESI